MPPKKKEEEPAPAPQEPVAPAPAVEAKEPVAPAQAPADEAKAEPKFETATAGMAALTVTEKKIKFTPTKAENQYFLRGDEKNMLISMDRKAGDAAITGMGARSTLKSVSKGDLVWIAKILPAKVD
eukprot:g64031.t1